MCRLLNTSRQKRRTFLNLLSVGLFLIVLLIDSLGMYCFTQCNVAGLTAQKYNYFFVNDVRYRCKYKCQITSKTSEKDMLCFLSVDLINAKDQHSHLIVKKNFLLISLVISSVLCIFVRGFAGWVLRRNINTNFILTTEKHPSKL